MAVSLTEVGLNKKPGKHMQAPQRQLETGHQPSRTRQICFTSRPVQTPGLLLDLLSQRSGGWRPHGWQLGVEFHEAD